MNPNKIAEWIKSKVVESGAVGCVVGLSGGVDSAVVAALCKKAVGKKTLCLILPCQSSSDDINDALSVIKKIKSEYRIIDLTPIYETLLSLLPLGKKLACANLKPRLRMLTIYYFSNLNNYLVVGTGNKSEISVGYFTKYGDGGVDILPLGNMYKSQVLKLAKTLGIDKKIIDKPPSAGLWSGQIDEGEMGITYRELEEVLRGKKRSAKVAKMVKSSEHKRGMPEIYTETK